jgi:hypothetical protein
MVGKALRTATKQSGKPPKVFRNLTITPEKDAKGNHTGGVVIEHHFESYEHPSEPHPFGVTEGKQALAHIAEHTGIDTKGLELNDESEGEEDKTAVAPKD